MERVDLEEHERGRRPDREPRRRTAPDRRGEERDEHDPRRVAARERVVERGIVEVADPDLRPRNHVLERDLDQHRTGERGEDREAAPRQPPREPDDEHRRQQCVSRQRYGVGGDVEDGVGIAERNLILQERRRPLRPVEPGHQMGEPDAVDRRQRARPDERREPGERDRKDGGEESYATTRYTWNTSA